MVLGAVFLTKCVNKSIKDLRYFWIIPGRGLGRHQGPTRPSGMTVLGPLVRLWRLLASVGVPMAFLGIPLSLGATFKTTEGNEIKIHMNM